MNTVEKKLQNIKDSLPDTITLVAVSKTKPIATLMEAYTAGQRIFGENKIQEMVEKWEAMPKDIQWHMIGHVQTNKVKYMASFVDLIHAVDSIKLLKEINKQAKKHSRIINCLLQIKIAEEESKFGLSKEEAIALLESEEIKNLANIHIQGLMGMATFTDDQSQIKAEFEKIQTLFKHLKQNNPNLKTLSIGMSGDFKIAIETGSTMVRVGSSIFGSRNQA
ncbi:YggS family pyridoxal phosphate-dependent enzyme [Aquimarina sp. U1-2]|uniref:YggS family pyridoxal phosphate-dependent enzyme n=1 Tax=Aquimarina sp. U1-2 TaxID=2823141 RepID=UPI001AECF44F|nr:YggS family pyridoxal phosphate-dependent enzyme [Aquimarina sp. U1-2]MBP2833893.1 YggS family pyridoxal phosphate-dependent enzyme [Aquimarina sp. U1-2]